MMRPAPVLLVLLVSIFALSGCVTRALWTATDPHYFVKVPADRVREKELKEKGIKYFISDKGKAFYVEKNDLQKVGGYTLRVFATPITIVIDAVTTIVVVGAVGFAGDIKLKSEDQCDRDPTCLQHKHEGTYSR